MRHTCTVVGYLIATRGLYDLSSDKIQINREDPPTPVPFSNSSPVQVTRLHPVRLA